MENQSINDLIAKTKLIVSVEFFPPKNEIGGEQILYTADQLQSYCRPDFVSITYGAGGSTQERTLKYASILREKYKFKVMPHLTCIGMSSAQLRQIINNYYEQGFRNLMALRGDPPIGETHFVSHSQDLYYASELVTLIKQQSSNFCIGVAGYPEKHPQSATYEKDIEYLKHKVNCGASFITTQLFYDNQHFFAFLKRCQKAGIQVPIIPGIMPALSLKQVRRFCSLCESTLPEELEEKLKAAGSDENAVRHVGIDWAYKQIKELIEHGVKGIHLYILNQSYSMLALIKQLTANGILVRTNYK
jgi:methylenetetrahydrofolate reductase (NADPH)